jgi:hypothetical protein
MKQPQARKPRLAERQALQTAARVALFAAAGILAGGLNAADLPARDAYAFGFPLTAGAESEYFAVDLPLAVYRSVADPALRDVGVYNANRLPVPRLIERPGVDNGAHDGAGQAPAEEEIALGLIPLYGSRAVPSEQLRLLLLHGGDSTRLELDTERPPPQASAADGAGAPDRTLAGYLVDARQLEQPLQALALAWPPPAEGFIGTVRVDTSEDLQHWRHLGSAALADLEFQGTRIEQNHVQLERPVADYLRIRWQEMPAGWRLSEVRGIYTGPGPAVQRDWLELDSHAPGEGAAESLFDAAGYPPVDRVNLLLPDGNVVVRAGVYYRLPGSEEWRLAHSGVFYNVSRRGGTLQSPAAAVGGRAGALRAADWKVRIESGVAAGPVRLQLGWRPDRLLFLAQGPAPFELVAGRAADAAQRFPQATVLGDTGLFEMLRSSGQAGPASLGPRAEIAGPAALQMAEPVRRKALLIWAGLIAAIAVVGWLVLSLLRENRAQGA